MKAIFNVLGFLTYWLFRKENEERSVEIVLGLDWLWIRRLLEVDFEAWIKLFEGWRRWWKSGLETWKEFDVCKGNNGLIFGIFEVIAYEAFVFLDEKRSWGLRRVLIRWRIFTLQKLLSKEVRKGIQLSFDKFNFKIKVWN